MRQRLSLFFFLSLLSCSKPVQQFDGTFAPYQSSSSLDKKKETAKENINLEAELSLTDLIDIALQNNPETKYAWYRAKAAAARVGLAKSEWYPRIDAKADGMRLRTFEFLGGPEITDYRAHAGAMLSYLLLDFGERSAAVEEAKEGLKIANWSRDWAMQEVIIKLLGSYYEYLTIKGLFEVELAAAREAEERLEATKHLWEAGLKSKSDVLAAQSDWTQAKLRLSNKNKQVKIARAALAKEAGLPIESEVKVNSLPEITSKEQITETFDALISEAKKNRADLLALKTEMSRKNLEIKRVKASLWPKIDALAKGGWEYDQKSPSHGIYQYAVGVSLSAPLFNGFKKSYECKRAYAEAQSTLADIAAKEQAIAFDVFHNFETLKAAEETIKLSKESLSYAEEAYNAALEQYEAGFISIFSLIDLGKMLSQARESKLQANIHWFAGVAQLAYSTGTLLEDL